MQHLALLLFFLNLSPTAFAQPGKLDNFNVVLLPRNMDAPQQAKKIGTFTFGNNGTRINCNYETDIAYAKAKAHKMGGNIVKITELIDPSFVSKCYKIKADVYSGDITPFLPAQMLNNKPDTANDTLPHATLYVYRLADTIALAMSYALHLNNDSDMCRMHGRAHHIFHLYKEGPTKLWGKLESERSVSINVQFGHTYYLRCGTVQGNVIGVPVLQLVDEQTGAAEFRKLQYGKQDMDKSYLDKVH